MTLEEWAGHFRNAAEETGHGDEITIRVEERYGMKQIVIQPHDYLSTGCLHGDHEYCKKEARRYDGTEKVAACCKFCGAPCICTCHVEEEGAL